MPRDLPGKYADLAIPALLELVRRAGARKERLEIVIVGGAKMFALGAGLDIGARNDAAVREGSAGSRAVAPRRRNRGHLRPDRARVRQPRASSRSTRPAGSR